MFRMVFLLTLSLAAFQFARADEIEDRIRRRQQADDAASEQQSAASRYQTNTSRLRVYQNFAAVHGGVTDSGTCKVGLKECREGMFDRSRPFCTYWATGSTSFTGFDPSADHVLQSCRLTLNDGLACDVSVNYKDNKLFEEKWFKADCYDQSGNYSLLSFGANGGKLAPKKYPPRIRVGKGKCSYECDGDDGKRYTYRTSYCPSWAFAEQLPSGVNLSCK